MNQILNRDLLTPESLDDSSAEPRVLVTGGASGLGRSIAERFFQDNARVHIADRSAERLAATLAAFPGMHGTQTDVTEPSEVAALADEVDEWMEGVDLLVNATRYVGSRAAVETIELEEWQDSFANNVTGAFLCVRQFVPKMKQHGSGCVINIGTTSARTGLPRRLAYVTSGSALLGLTLNLARELGPFNIRCNAVLGGMVESDEGRRLIDTMKRNRHLSEEEAEAEVLRHVSMRTWIEPEEIADTVAYLASPAARHVNGQVLSVCGNVEWEG